MRVIPRFQGSPCVIPTEILGLAEPVSGCVMEQSHRTGNKTGEQKQVVVGEPTGIVWNPSFLRAVAKQFPAVCVLVLRSMRKAMRKAGAREVCCVVLGSQVLGAVLLGRPGEMQLS